MDFIREFWETQGATHKASHCASWGDKFAIELELETVSKFIKSGDRVLDIGCANGFSTFRQLEINPTAHFTGIDYAQTMIDNAVETSIGRKLTDEQVRFSVASALELPFDDGAFDVAYTTRLLINLANWNLQQQALVEALRVVRKGGLLVISEGFWEPLCLLNGMRLLLRLEPLAEHDFNRYLKKAKLEEWLKSRQLSFEVEDFSSLYYLGTRLMRELIMKELPPPGDYSSPVNAAFFELQRKFSGGGIGVQQAYVIRK